MIFKQSPGFVTDLKLNSATPTAKTYLSSKSICLICRYIFTLRIAEPTCSWLFCLLFCTVFFLHCFVDFLRLCLRFPALCRTLLHVSEPLRLKRLLKHPATEAAVTETCRNIHVLSCFLHVLKQSRNLISQAGFAADSLGQLRTHCNGSLRACSVARFQSALVLNLSLRLQNRAI